MKLRHLVTQTLWALLSLLITCSFIAGIAILYFEMQLPNIYVLKDAQLQVPLRIYTKDAHLIAEYGAKRRNPVILSQVPKILTKAVLATEDQRFYEHPGVDPIGLMRAAVILISTGKKSQGGSTITMQVARNFFLTRKKTYSRKIKEILLAVKIDNKFSKEKILELYLNKIYFGNRAYGIASAAQVYYGKTLDQLTLAQTAMLAGLPKAPSALNPIANPPAAKKRRDHVLKRMLGRGDITQQQYTQATNATISASYHGEPISVNSMYSAEMVRSGMEEYFGTNVYNSGLKVYTTIDTKAQKAANNALYRALIAYDQRHGYSGPTDNWGIPKDQETLQIWEKNLQQIPTINGLQPAVVTDEQERSAEVLLSDGKIIDIPWKGLKWARKKLKGQFVGATPKQTSDVIELGDLIKVQKLGNGSWRLAQVPEVQGALIALRPKDGAILALVGGFDYRTSKYNRVTQAERQPGSSFKPFIYAAALAKGYTLASIINDAPVVVNDPSLDTLWRPQNDTRKFYGPTRLRIGLVESRNLVSIRLLQDIKIPYAIKYISRFGFHPTNLPKSLSLALGTAVATPLDLTTGYAVFANGGYKINPYLIDHITDSSGKIIYQSTPLIAVGDYYKQPNDQVAPIIQEQQAPRVIAPQTAYIMTSVLKDVIQSGTARSARVLNRSDLAGKTGTTNKKMDAWFSGFNKDIVATTWVGFDKPKTLREYGAQVALPMWIDFMRSYLKGQPESNIPEAPGIVVVKIDPKTGLVAQPQEKDGIFEIFRKQYAPTDQAPNVAPNQDDISEAWPQQLF